MAQHAGKLLGYQQIGLSDLNLKNTEFATDTYQIFINKLRKILVDNNPERWNNSLLKLLTRSTLKNLIMTVGYGVTLRTARVEFEETIRSLCLTNQDYKKLLGKGVIEELYDVLRGGSLDAHFYLNTKQAWVRDFTLSNRKYFCLQDIKVPIEYYHNIPATIYFNRVIEDDKRSRNTLSVNFFI
jgi:hypothetical protein